VKGAQFVKEPIALVNKIIDQSAVDGPGNRTVVFFQGCNFNCGYCHNPETIGICNRCGACLDVRPADAPVLSGGHLRLDEAKCRGCGAEVPSGLRADTSAARPMTADEIASHIARNRPFIRGITCSGGECTLYADVMTRLFILTRRMGLTNLIDSNGSYDFFSDRALLDSADGVMLDIKAFDPQVHKALTGWDNILVLQNAVRLAAEGLLPEIRTVVIPGALPNEQTVDGITRTLAPYLRAGNIRYRLIRYNAAGVREGCQGLASPDDALMARLKSIAAQNGFFDIVTG
jgi:pyruvate formate lyase activating enzyme